MLVLASVSCHRLRRFSLIFDVLQVAHQVLEPSKGGKTVILGLALVVETVEGVVQVDAVASKAGGTVLRILSGVATQRVQKVGKAAELRSSVVRGLRVLSLKDASVQPKGLVKIDIVGAERDAVSCSLIIRRTRRRCGTRRALIIRRTRRRCGTRRALTTRRTRRRYGTRRALII